MGVHVTQSFTTPLTLPGMKIGIVSNKNNDLCIDYMKIR